MTWMTEEDRCATPQEACWEYARNVGSERPDCAWILTDYDTFERNPHYRGPPCLADVNPYSDNPDLAFLDLHAACGGGRKCLHGFGDPVYGPDKRLAGPSPAYEPNDIPF